MKLQSTAKTKGQHSEYVFHHRVKGTLLGISVVAFNEQRATEKAWGLIKQIYKDVKIYKDEPFEMPHGVLRVGKSAYKG